MSLLGDTAELAILLKLKDEVSGPLKNIERSLATTNTHAATVSGGMGKIGQGLGLAATRIAAAGLTAGVAIGGIAIAAVKSASTFQASMELIATQAGGTQAEVAAMTKGVLAMTTEVGTSADELAAGLYHIESAGLRGAKALDVLRAAAEGAKVGNADLESVTNALIAAVNSGVKGTTDMGQAMGVLNAVVGSGNMRMQDLADAFGTGILSSAKTFGVSIQSVGAAIADMTNQGIPANDAATRLRMTLSLLAAPTSKAATELKSIGINSTDLANAMRGPDGILGAVAMLKDHLDKSGLSLTQQAALLSNAFGGGRSSSAIMTLIGSVGKLKDIQDQVNKGAAGFGDAWAKTQEDVDFKAAKVGATLDRLKLQLGSALLPAAGNILDAISQTLSRPEVTQGITDFGNALAAAFSPQNIDAAVKFAASVIPPIVSGAQLLFGVAKQGFDLFNSLPSELKTVAIAALIGNKLTGGLVASGIKDVSTALLRGAGSKLPGPLGGIVGAATATPVFVTNWPATFGPGGGNPIKTVEDVATKLAPEGIAAALTGASTLAAGVVLTLAMGYLPQLNPFGKGPAKDRTVASGPMAGTTLPATGYMSIDALSQGNAALAGLIQANTKPANTTLGRDMDKNIVSGITAAEKKLAREDAANAEVNAQKIADSINRQANDARDDVHRQLAGQLDAKRAVTDALALVAVYSSGTAKNTQWIGKTEGELKQLQAKYMATGDKATAAKLGAAIKQLQAEEKVAAHREAVAQINAIKANADRITSQTAPKLSDLRALMTKGNGVMQTLKKNNNTADAAVLAPILWTLNTSILRINPSQGYTPGGAPGYQSHAGLDDPSGGKYVPSPGTSSGSTSGGTSGTGGGSRMHAAGLLGFTQGLTNLGIAGEAGREAVAIIRNPRPFSPAAMPPVQPLTVHLHTSVSARQNEAAHVSQNRWGPTRVLQGARG